MVDRGATGPTAATCALGGPKRAEARRVSSWVGSGGLGSAGRGSGRAGLPRARPGRGGANREGRTRSSRTKSDKAVGRSGPRRVGWGRAWFGGRSSPLRRGPAVGSGRAAGSGRAGVAVRPCRVASGRARDRVGESDQSELASTTGSRPRNSKRIGGAALQRLPSSACSWNLMHTGSAVSGGTASFKAG